MLHNFTRYLATVNDLYIEKQEILMRSHEGDEGELKSQSSIGKINERLQGEQLFDQTIKFYDYMAFEVLLPFMTELVSEHFDEILQKLVSIEGDKSVSRQ